MERVREVNKVTDVSQIHAGDKLFIPAAGIVHLIVPDDGSNFQSSSKSGTHVVLGIAIAAVMVFLILAAMIFWIFYKRRSRKQNVAFLGGTKSSLFSLTSPSCVWRSSSRLKSRSASEGSKGSSRSFKSIKTVVFPYLEVCDATANFSESQKIGQGSYGCVYRGRLRGLVVAVKQMKNTKSKEFFAELSILCKVYHDNLIELIGYSSGADSLCLVYEFAQNGALSDHLHNPSAKGHKPLSWSLRVQIALDAAKGLEYIHVYIKPFCVHRDVKPSNILLDSDFCSKISDFGLVKLLEHSPEVGAVTSKIVGTFGYLAPEYVRDGCVTPKTDVYAFGVVLMELITGKHALTRGKSVRNDQNVEHQSVVDCVLSALDDEHDPVAKLQEIVDSNLIHYEKDSVFQMALLSKDCVDDDWKRRPDMSQVVHRLSEIVSSMERDEIKLNNSLC